MYGGVPPDQFTYMVTFWPAVTELEDVCIEDDNAGIGVFVMVTVTVDWELCPAESFTTRQRYIACVLGENCAKREVL